jgi:hypothetical protein
VSASFTARLVTLGLLAITTACGSASREAPPASEPGVFHRTTQTGYYDVDVTFDPRVPAAGELFTVTAVVHEKDGRPMERGKVTLDARMPQHGHGMETKPVQDEGTCTGDVCTHPGGRYRAEGFKFHMPGAWTVTIDVVGPRGPDNTSFVVELP